MKISTEQLDLLDFYSKNAFVNELSEHCKEAFPFIFNELGSKNFKVGLANLINKAKASNIMQRGPLQLYIDMAIVLGSGFNTDPMYSCFGFVNEQHSSGTELERSMLIYDKFNEYLTDVLGEGNIHILDFKNKLASERFDGFSNIDLNNQIFDLLKKLYPQKCMYLGCDKSNDLICLGLEKSDTYCLSLNVRAAFVLVMFIVGHEFESDYFHLYEGFFSLEKDCDDQFLIYKAKGFLTKYIDALIT